MYRIRVASSWISRPLYKRKFNGSFADRLLISWLSLLSVKPSPASNFFWLNVLDLQLADLRSWMFLKIILFSLTSPFKLKISGYIACLYKQIWNKRYIILLKKSLLDTGLSAESKELVFHARTKTFHNYENSHWPLETYLIRETFHELYQTWIKVSL